MRKTTFNKSLQSTSNPTEKSQTQNSPPINDSIREILGLFYNDHLKKAEKEKKIKEGEVTLREDRLPNLPS